MPQSPMYARLAPGAHDDPNQAVADIVVIENGLDGGEAPAPAWADITGKPTTFPPTIGTTATTAKAGNYTPTAATVTATAITPGTATTVQGVLAELAARIAALEDAAA